MTGTGKAALRQSRNQVILFGLVGLANTIVGYGTIILFMEGLGWSPWTSNAMGYAVGLAMGFVLNRRLTFQSEVSGSGGFTRYVLAFILAYAINLIVLAVALGTLVDMRLVAQAIAMIAYTGVFFIACKYYVFRPAQCADDVVS